MEHNQKFKVSKLYRYPVKSMGAEPMDTAQICSTGFVGDRRYAIQETSNNIICSAKMLNKFGSLLEFSARYLNEPTLNGPLPPVEITFPDGRKMTSQQPELNPALSKAFGVEVQLIHQAHQGAEADMLWGVTEGHAATQWTNDRKIGEEDGKDKVRFKLAEAVPDIEEYDTFFDLSPIHLVTTSTLKYFEMKAPGINFDPMRFRPNIVLEGPFVGLAEQQWSGKQISFGEVVLNVDYPTVRCGMPTLPQRRLGLGKSRETIQAIARHNTIEVEALGPGPWACVGAYARIISHGNLGVGVEMDFA